MERAPEGSGSSYAGGCEGGQAAGKATQAAARATKWLRGRPGGCEGGPGSGCTCAERTREPGRAGLKEIREAVSCDLAISGMGSLLRRLQAVNSALAASKTTTCNGKTVRGHAIRAA